MADLPELSDSTKRKVALQWSSLLDTHSLTGEHFHWHEQARERLCRAVAQSSGPGPGWRNQGRLDVERAADKAGIHSSVALAEERFKDLAGEYWRLWRSSGDGYEAFVGWLDTLRRQVSTEVASVWAAGSEAIDRWYERACGPAVAKALAALVKEGTGRARADELKRLERGATAPSRDELTRPEARPSLRRMAKSGPSEKPQAPVAKAEPPEKKRAAQRCAFLEEKLGPLGWSELDLANHGGPSYNTICLSYKAGKKVTRSTRKKIADGLKCAFSEVSE